MGYVDEEKQKIYQHEWYMKNKEKTIKRVAIARKERQEIVNGFKKRCEKCGEDDIVCLDFHHVDDNKVDAVSQMALDNRKIEIILDEIEKCIVVCRNCHAKIHRDIREQKLLP